MSVTQYTAKMTGKGIWVQKILDDGNQINGTVVTGTLDEFRFATREVAQLDENGEPRMHLGVIRGDAQFLELVVPATMPPLVVGRLYLWIKQLDAQRLGRQVEVIVSDALLGRLHRSIHWFWPKYDKVMTWLGRMTPMIPTV